MTSSPRVVIHLDEREKAALALRNVKNLVTDLEGVEVEVVVHADGVEGIRAGGPNAGLMDLLAGRGVRLVVCEQTLGSRNLTAENLPGYVETVPSGIVELVLHPAVKKVSYASRTALTTPSWLGLLMIRARPISVLMMAPLVRRFRRT